MELLNFIAKGAVIFLFASILFPMVVNINVHAFLSARDRARIEYLKKLKDL